MKRTGALVGLLLIAGPSFAVGSLADVAVYDRVSDTILPVYAADGRWYVAGRLGNEYELRIRNNSSADVLAVVSVDGVNVVGGETAATDQGGYVIGAGQSLQIKGWRKSLARVANFYFTDHSDAYATRTGRPNDVGVIGVAMFKRKAAPPAYLEEPQVRSQAPFEGRSKSQAGVAEDAGVGSSDNAPRSVAPAPERSIGTGHGRSAISHARYVSFERESDTPNEIVAIRYDTRANLVARGIIQQQAREPNPFPNRFVPDPPRGW